MKKIGLVNVSLFAWQTRLLLGSVITPLKWLKKLYVSRMQANKITIFHKMFRQKWAYHSVHWGINPPSKTPPPLSCQAPPPPKPANCPSPPFLGNPPYILAFREPPFLSLNIPDFSLFFVEKLQPPLKKSHL